MITYVNTVLVSNVPSNSSNIAANTVVDGAITATAFENGTDGQYIIIDADTNGVISTASDMADTVKRIKIGMFTGETNKGVKVIRWSNIINRADIKKFSKLNASSAVVTEDSMYIDFGSLTDIVNHDNITNSAAAGKRIIVRLTFKDLPTRYRKWTESYEYVTVEGDTKATITANIAKLINKQVKRARVVAKVGSVDTTSGAEGIIPGSTTKYFHTDSNWGTTTATTGTVIQLVAMPYDDDNSAESINRFDKVRFNANIYWTDPAAEGWAALNKMFPKGATITKVPGFQYAASGKLVRDREQAALGYMGIINHGQGTWPIVQPAMRVNIANNYNAVTLEFENAYHTADDLMRKTKQTVELYFMGAFGSTNTIDAILAKFAGTSSAGEAYQVPDIETEDFA